MKIAAAVGILLVAIAGCDSEFTYNPTLEEIRTHRWIESFVVDPSAVQGLYRNSDVDALLFRYSTSVPRSTVWTRISEQTKRDGWTLMGEDEQLRTFRRIRTGGAYPSTEEVRVAPLRTDILVGYVQVDHLHENGFHRGTEDGWAKTFWSMFEDARRDESR